MITGIRLDELRELARLFPVKLAALDDNAAKCRAVPADKFSRAVDDNIRAEFKRANLIGRGERVINDERDFMLVRNVGDGLNINERGVGIADGLDKNQARVVLNRRLENANALCRVNKSRLDTEGGQRVFKKIEGAAVNRRRRNDMMTLLRESLDGISNSRRAACDCQSR